MKKEVNLDLSNFVSVFFDWFNENDLGQVQYLKEFVKDVTKDGTKVNWSDDDKYTNRFVNGSRNLPKPIARVISKRLCEKKFIEYIDTLDAKQKRNLITDLIDKKLSKGCETGYESIGCYNKFREILENIYKKRTTL